VGTPCSQNLTICEPDPRNADLRDALSQLTGAREEIQRARLSLANLSQVRTHADAVVSNASTRYFNCARALSKLQDKRDMFWGDVQKAQREIELAQVSVASAEDRLVSASQNVSLSQKLRQQVLVSLNLDSKYSRKVEAVAKETHAKAAEQAALRQEKREAKSLRAHEKHMKLVESQCDVTGKDKEQKAAKSRRADAEKHLISAQKHLDEVAKTRADHHSELQKCYGQHAKLIEEYRVALLEYDKQDPSERERSFATSMESSGADPDLL